MTHLTRCILHKKLVGKFLYVRFGIIDYAIHVLHAIHLFTASDSFLKAQHGSRSLLNVNLVSWVFSQTCFPCRDSTRYCILEKSKFKC